MGFCRPPELKRKKGAGEKSGKWQQFFKKGPSFTLVFHRISPYLPKTGIMGLVHGRPKERGIDAVGSSPAASFGVTYVFRFG
jgi:hypothetical protein